MLNPTTIESNKLSFKKRLAEAKEKALALSEHFISIPKHELNSLNDKTINDICASDPSPILEEYFGNVSYKGGRYEFRVRCDDTTKSCFMSLHNGSWIYNDFGDSSNNRTGNILKLLKLHTSMNFAESVKYCVNKLNLVDYGEQALAEVRLQNYYIKQQNQVVMNQPVSKYNIEDIMKKAEKCAKELKEKNAVIEKESENFSRVSFISKTIPLKFVKMLQDRGINQVPKGLYHIKGENFKRDGEALVKTSDVEGVGVLTANNEHLLELEKLMLQVNERGFAGLSESLDNIKFGGDVHFIPYIDKSGTNRKTQSFGVKGVGLIINHHANKKLLVCESKMDYSSADEVFDFAKQGFNVILANSINNNKKIIEYIKNSLYTDIYNLNQNDAPALAFTTSIMKECNINKFGFIEYKKDEYKKDINDLNNDGVNLYDRFKIGTLKDFKGQVVQMKEYLECNSLMTPQLENTFTTIFNTIEPIKKETVTTTEPKSEDASEKRPSYRKISKN